MNFVILPTLEHAAVVRTASLFCDNCELEDILEQTRAIRENRAMEIDGKLSFLLPPPLRKKVIKVVHQMQLEVIQWKIDHKSHLEHIGGWLLACFCWKTDATINRIETARRIIANENINPTTRFILACTYFLEDEVVALWGERHEQIENHIAEFHVNMSVRFWMEWLRNEGIEHWSGMIDGYFRNQRFLPGDIPLSASSFYHLLSSESKRFIELTNTAKVHNADFYACVNKMDEMERVEFFRSEPSSVLKYCFRWPFRCLYIQMAEEVIGYLSRLQFVDVLRYMLSVLNHFEDEDFHVFETFWKISPSTLQDGAKRNPFIAGMIKKILKDENGPQDLKEILRKLFLKDQSFSDFHHMTL